MTSDSSSHTDHDHLVANQFGARADAYVASAIHASSEDLTQIEQHAAYLQPSHALDLGCGGGHVSFSIAPHAEKVISYDLSAEMLAAVARAAAARDLKNIETQQGSVTKLPFSDGAFDFIASRFSAHHWQDLPAAMREARRVCAPGGHAIFADIVSSETALFDTWLQAMELLRDPSHVRHYRASEWRAALTAAGFKPGAAMIRRLRQEFTSWVERIATPEVNVRALKALRTAVPKEAADYLDLEADGSFSVDVMVLEATPI